MRKNGKKLLSLVLAMVMVLGMAHATAFAAEPTSGVCGSGLTWSLSNGTLVISGTGKMSNYMRDKSNYYESAAPWYGSRSSIQAVIIEEGVTSIGTNAFYGCTNMTKATIPNGVTSIGNSAFYWCLSLTSADIPNSVTSIGTEAFVNCDLTSVTIPDSVTSMGTSVFVGNFNMTSLIIGSGVTSIRESSFSGCRSLTSVTIPDGVTVIGPSAFRQCEGLTSVTIPSSVTAVNPWAFVSCNSLKNVYYSGTAEQWNAIAIFSNNEPLTNATIHYNSSGDTPDTPDTPGTPAGDSVILALEPETGATFPGTVFDITFDRDVAESTSNQNLPVVDLSGPAPFQIHRKSDDAVVYTVDSQNKVINDFRYGASRAVLRVNPTNANALLKDGTEYYVTMGAGFVKFTDGSVSPEIKKGEWVFRCGPASSGDGSTGGALPTVENIPAAGTAVARTQTVKLDGRDVEFQYYAVKDAAGNESNYVKLRDLAMALNGTKAQFNVGWDGKISITSGAAYTAVGGEGATPYTGNQPYKTVSSTSVSFNGSAVNLTSFSITYQGGGYTYYKLRDLGQLLNFNVKWDGGVVIETDKPYTGT